MVTSEDDYPHPVPPQAFMTWKENWVFPAVDTEQRVATLFHFSLRPGAGEGIFTAKLCIDDWEHRYVGRSPVPADLPAFVPVRNERLTFEVVEPATRFRITYRGEELDADLEYTARFPPWDFDDNALAPGDSPLGDRGRGVFHFHHYEQALRHEGTITLRAGPRAGETIRVSGYANRDHSWGWREDLTFRHHHWLCASFEDRFVQGTVMNEQCYPHGDKHGGWISTEAANVAVAQVDTSDAYWLTPGEPLPRLDRDVRYRLTTADGAVRTSREPSRARAISPTMRRAPSSTVSPEASCFVIRWAQASSRGSAPARISSSRASRQPGSFDMARRTSRQITFPEPSQIALTGASRYRRGRIDSST